MRPLFIVPLDMTITALTGEQANFPATQLGSLYPTSVARGEATAADVEIDIDLGTAKEVAACGLLFHQEAAGTTLALHRADLSDFSDAVPVATGSAFHSPNDPGFDWRHGLLTFAPATARYWRLVVSARSAVTFEAGRLVIGPSFQPQKSVSYGWGPRMADSGTVTNAPSGLPVPGATRVRNGLDLTFEAFSEEDLKAWRADIYAKRGSTREILVLADPDNTERGEADLVYGLMDEPKMQNHAFRRFKMKLGVAGI